MRRREFIALVGGAAAAWSLRVSAQAAGKISRVALIVTTAPASELAGLDPTHPPTRAFLHAMRDLGYVEGRNLVLERRSAGGQYERFGEIATELVGSGIDVIVTVGNDLAREVKRVTSTVPIVMATSNDPVAAGIVANLAQPGGNITGFTVHGGTDFEGKRMELLKELAPQLTRVAFLGVKDDWEGPVGVAVREAARTLGMTLLHAEHTPTNYADALALISRNRPLAMFVTRHNANYANRQAILMFALEHQIPGMYPFREFADAGGLISYGVNIPDLWRRAAGHVDKILKGTKPGDLPVEQPTKYELVINLKTAKALGLTVPPSLLARADELIE